MKTQPSYMPSPQQIKAACAEIQAGWTATESKQRAGAMELRGWKPQELEAIDVDGNPSNKLADE